VHIEELERKNAELCVELDSLKQQLDWFKRQLFGSKSEKRLDVDSSVQGNLLAGLGVTPPPPPKMNPKKPLPTSGARKHATALSLARACVSVTMSRGRSLLSAILRSRPSRKTAAN
jgi:hypothetical protein